MLVLEYMLLQKKLAKLNIDTPYKTLKIKEQMQQLVTSIENKKQAITIYLESLEGNPKEEKAAPDITAADLIIDNGMGKLDRVFWSETIVEAYNIYSKFILFKKKQMK